MCLEYLHSEGIEEFVLSLVSCLRTQTWLPVGSLSFSKTEIDKDALSLGVVIEKVGWFDVSVENAGLVDMPKSVEETPEVVSHVVYQEISIVQSKVQMPKVWQYGNDLVEVSECRQQRTYVW